MSPFVNTVRFRFKLESGLDPKIQDPGKAVRGILAFDRRFPYKRVAIVSTWVLEGGGGGGAAGGVRGYHVAILLFVYIYICMCVYIYIYVYRQFWCRLNLKHTAGNSSFFASALG